MHGSSSLPGKPRTGVVSGLETQPRTAATHRLESRGEASSAGLKRSHARQPLTNWRAEDRPRQPAGNTAAHCSHSQTGEPRTGVVSGLETQPRTAATHNLESRGQASLVGLKRSHAWQPLTIWRAEDRRRQRARNAATHGSHSLSGEPRTGVVSELETQPRTAATHKLESRGQASSAGLKRSHARQPLTDWRAEDRRRQRVRNAATNGSHSLSGEPRIGVVSWLETQLRMAATHFLESRGQASSAGLKRRHAREPLTDWRAEDRRRQRVKRSHARQPLTNWRAEDRR